MSSTRLQWALSYARLGWPVFPVQQNGKAPAVSGGFQTATLDESQINLWWKKNPDYNIGVATGKGLFVVDLDCKKDVDGLQFLHDWESQHSMLPQTVMSRTPSGGKHLFYQSDSTIRCKVGIYPGVDIRGDGGYVVVPPSKIDGKEYSWESPPGISTVAEANSTVFTFLNPVPDSIGKTPDPFLMPEIVEEGKRTDTLMKMLGSMQAKGYTDGAIRAAIMEENEVKCNPPLTSDELESTVFPALNRFQKGTAPYTMDREFDSVISGFVERLKELHPEANKRYGWHDAGNGNLFSDMSRGRVCYVPERKKWYFYDGRRWAADPGNTHTMELCKRLADALMIYTTQNIVDEKLRSDYIKHVAKWQGLKYRETLLKDASTVDPVSAGIFDTDRYLLNCQNGTLNLQTMEFYDHRSGDNATKLANVEYHPEARCERWERFISEVTNGDADLSRYIQKALGYALTGDTKHECFFILYGATSRNGKGTLSETFMYLMGDYGRTASPETIAKRKNSDSRAASEDVARLAGARFVNMSEPDKSMALNAALVKTLTGNDTINARYLNENSFEFRPNFKIFVNTNHLPYASDATLFTSGRVKVIPFNRHFEEHEQDRWLKQKLSKPDSLSGILNWCIEGLNLLNAEGLNVPGAVREATLSYNEISDKTGQFVDECLQENPAAEIAAKTVHSIYQNWCMENGFKPKGYDEFMKSIASAGMQTKRKRPIGAGRNANKANFIIGFQAKT